MRSRKRDTDLDVVRITAAPVNPSEDVAGRQRRYLISMAVRTICFVGAVVSYTNGLHWFAWTLIAASFALPFVAVVIANAASPRIPEDLDGPGFDAGYRYRELE